MTFADQIWLSFVDKALLGGIVALIGFYATRAIEAYRAKQVLRTELTKQRLLKIEDIWKRMFDIEVSIRALHHSLAAEWILPTVSQPDEARLQEVRESWRNFIATKKDAVDDANAKFDDMILAIARDSFWLGRDLTQKAKEQIASIRSGFKSLLAGDTITAGDSAGFSTTLTITTHTVDVDYIMANL